MPITFPVVSATSAAQTIPTAQVFDYVLSGGVAQKNVTVRCILDGNAQTTISPLTLITPLDVQTTTDANGYFSFTLVPTDNMQPANCTYTIVTPFRTYQITVPSGGPWQTTAVGIIVNTPVALAPAVTGLTGPLTISSGGLTVSAGGATIAGGLTISSGTFAIATGGFTMAGPLTLTAATSQIIPGGTSFSVRDTGNAFDNLLVSNAGLVTARAGLVATAGGLTVSAGGAAITGNAVVTGTLTATSTLTVSAGGLGVTGNSTVTGSLGVTALLTAQAGLTVSAGTLTVTAGTLTMGATASQIVPGATSLSLRNHANGADNLLLTDIGLATLRNALQIPPIAGGSLAASSYGHVPVKIDEKSGATATYDFTSIPAGYRDLELRFYLRDTSGTVGLGAVQITFNADAGANYFTEGLQIHGTTTTVPTEALTANNWGVFMAVGGGSTANLHSGGTARIHGYAGAALKSALLSAFVPTAVSTGNQNMIQHSAWWNNVAAITRVTLTPGTGFDANSYCELWGMP